MKQNVLQFFENNFISINFVWKEVFGMSRVKKKPLKMMKFNFINGKTFSWHCIWLRWRNPSKSVRLSMNISKNHSTRNLSSERQRRNEPNCINKWTFERNEWKENWMTFSTTIRKPLSSLSVANFVTYAIYEIQDSEMRELFNVL